MPSKLLIAAAEAAHAIERAPGFGVHAEARIDGREVMARVRRERDRFVGFVLQGVESIPAGDRSAATRSSSRRNTLEVDGDAIEARDRDRHRLAPGDRRRSCATWATACRERRRVLVGDAAEVGGGVRPGVIGLELGQALAASACASWCSAAADASARSRIPSCTKRR
jgi:dihydrolipoamide dehydrogenase